MIGLRVFAGLLGLILTGVIIWAVAQTDTLQDFWYEGEALLSQPWGAAAMADLYIGFALTTIVIVLAERSVLAGLLWAAPIFLLGNIWTAAWLVLRLPDLASRLSRPDWPSS